MTSIQTLVVWILPVLFAITVHEAAHGWVAYRLGDPTAKELGRLTFNPIPHIDPVGTVILPAVLLLLGGIVFGWAKPVPVDPRRLKNMRRDMALVAVAGPGANLIMAVLWAVLLKIGLTTGNEYLLAMGQAGIIINLVLMALNILPILPLDGGRILHSLLPGNLAEPYARSEPFGLFIVLGLLFTGVLGILMNPIIEVGLHIVHLLVL